MIKTFTLSEFSEYLSTIPKSERIIYIGQSGSDISVYTSMYISRDMYYICFLNDDGCLFLADVNHIEIDTRKNKLGTVIHIVCEGVTTKNIMLIFQSSVNTY